MVQQMRLMDSFPAKLVPRPIQTDMLGRIGESLASGYKKIIVSAPTGTGKSPIAVSLAAHFERSLIVTASKHLQDQYSGEFEMLKSVKGKSNFACLKMMEREKIAREDIAGAIKMRMTCEKGECEEVRDGKKRNCKFKPTMREYESGKFDGTVCPYYNQKYEALTSPHSLWNYHSYFQIMKFNQKSYGKYLDRAVGVFDEAHKIEDQILQFIGIRIDRRNIDECGMDAGAYDLGDIDSVAGMLDDMARYYSAQISEYKKSPGFERDPDYDLLNRLDTSYYRWAGAASEIHSNKENFVIEDPKTGQGGFISLSIRPLDVSGYVERFFATPVQVFMSATIDKDSFCETMGISASEIDIVDAPKSPFSPESRKIEFLNVRSLSRRSTPDDEAAVIGTIDRILGEYAGKRGIILTSSKYRCDMILEGLSSANKSRVRICHSSNPGGKTQDHILNEHAACNDGVLLSSSLWEGIDLKDDLSRFQIIAKVPYPNLSEKRIMMKKDRYPRWYTSQTLTKLLQGFGRSIRGEEDWARTYVLDAAVQGLLGRARNMIPASYHDVLGMGSHQ